MQCIITNSLNRYQAEIDKQADEDAEIERMAKKLTDQLQHEDTDEAEKLRADVFEYVCISDEICDLLRHTTDPKIRDFINATLLNIATDEFYSEIPY
ncbi:hypothetical protein ACWA5Z_06540 [Testudinibacter sp. P80/BLE/0925]